MKWMSTLTNQHQKKIIRRKDIHLDYLNSSTIPL